MKRKAVRKPARPANKRAAVKKVLPIPAGYNVVIPYLPIRGASAAIEFYKKAFGAREVMRMPGPEGKLGHAEVQIGDSVVMLADEYESMNFLGPQSRGGTTVTIHLYVKDADATVARATALGAKVLRPIADQFYGDRTATLEDPFGHVWHVATHKEDVPAKELKRRAAEMAAKASS